jgi:hypothetical protein
VARGWSDSGEGGPEAGPDQVGKLVEEVRKQWAAGIWAEWSGRGEFRRGVRRQARCHEEEEEEIRRGRGVRVGFYRRARPRRREGERGAVSGRAHDGGRRSGRGAVSGAWQPLGTGGPTWLSGGWPAGAARAVGGVVGRCVGEGRAVQTCHNSGSGRRWRVTRVAEAGEIMRAKDV